MGLEFRDEVEQLGLQVGGEGERAAAALGLILEVEQEANGFAPDQGIVEG